MIALRTLVLVALVVVTSACGGVQNITAPTPVAFGAPAPLAAVNISSQQVSVPTEAPMTVQGLPVVWQRAAGCFIQKPAVPVDSLRGIVPAMAPWVNGASMKVRYRDPARSETETAVTCHDSFREEYQWDFFLEVEFIAEDGEWRYCSWLKATREIKATVLGGCEAGATSTLQKAEESWSFRQPQ